MDILYLLIPLSAVLVLGIIAIFAWALHGGQFDELEREGERILDPRGTALDQRQDEAGALRQQSQQNTKEKFE
jgi:cbb3-type cytochrome oxidase maturation protein